MLAFTTILPALALLTSVRAATKDEWRSRSVYQLLTDRFAPPAPNKECDLRSYCGGTWRTTIENLDYIQGMGFDAIWISPTGLGLDGWTKWGENYHGFWSVDPFAINPKFGTPSDLKDLSAALHARGMYLMVDIAVNHLAATDIDITNAALAAKSGGQLLFKEQRDFHPACDIQWGNQLSEQTCWLAQDGVALMDLKTEDARVASVLKEKFAAYMKEYGIDGARVDASKHMTKEFQNEFCGAANTFCIGEVYDKSTAVAASYTQGKGIDSVFGFGTMWGAVDVFAKDQPMSVLSKRADEASTSYADPSLVGAILDNHDLPRFNSLTSDKAKVYNAVALQFLFGGIPTMYYGLEQDIAFGASDPENRAPLWRFGNLGTDGESYKRIAKLNAIRTKLGENEGFHATVGKVVEETKDDIAFARNGTLLVLTKRGGGKGGDWTIAKAGWPANAKLVDLLSCKETSAGADGSMMVTFADGAPAFFVTEAAAAKAGICARSPEPTSATPSSTTATSTSTSMPASSPVSSSTSSSDASSSSSSVSSTTTDNAEPTTLSQVNGPVEAPVPAATESPATSRPAQPALPTRPPGSGGGTSGASARQYHLDYLLGGITALTAITMLLV